MTMTTKVKTAITMMTITVVSMMRMTSLAECLSLPRCS